MPESAPKKTRTRRYTLVVQHQTEELDWEDLAGYESTADAEKWIATEATEGVYRVACVWPALTVAVEEKPVRTVQAAAD